MTVPLQQIIFNLSFLLFLQGILSSVYLDGRSLHPWKMILIPLNNLNEVSKTNPIIQIAYSEFTEVSAHGRAKGKSSLFSDYDKNQERCTILLITLFSMVTIPSHFLFSQSTTPIHVPSMHQLVRL